LLRTLIQWALSSSEAIRGIINQTYKNRHEDDLNIPLSVQPWGSDGDKRRYYLIEGNDDTSFRVYRESNPAGLNRTWWSVAGSIDELRALAEKLETQDGGPKAKQLAKRIQNAIPRFEATEEKRRRREYRQMQKERFRRPEPGFSLYEGRTRGKRVKYTFSDNESDFYSDSTAPRRSARNTRNHTPSEPAQPVTTSSGRQVRAPNRLNAGADNASSGGVPSAPTSVQGDGDDGDDSRRVTRSGRPQRSAAANYGTNGWSTSSGTRKKRKSDEYLSDDEDEGSEPDFGDDEEEDEHVPDDTEDEDDEEFEEAELDEDEELSESNNNKSGAGRKRSFVFTFPIRVTFDEQNKVRQIPGPPPPAFAKHPRAANARRTVVVSEESEAGQETAGSVSPAPEPAAAATKEAISVATKQVPASTTTGSKTQQQQTTAPAEAKKEEKPSSDENDGDGDKPMLDAPVVVVNSPPTPTSSEQAAPSCLAIRGSPEAVRTAPRPVLDNAPAE
jgi:hypothetical protein